MPLTSDIAYQALLIGVPSDIAIALAQRESSLNHNVIGSSGEVGLFQILPTTAAELGINPYNLNENIQGGLTYLKQQYDRFGSWDLALAAYNAGPTKVASGNIPQSTQSYVQDILGYPIFQSSLAPPFTFSTTVYSTPLGDFPWWVLAIGIGALAYLIAKKF